VAGPSDLTRIADEAVKDIAAAADDAALEAARVRYLSRKDGVVTSATKAIATLPNADAPYAAVSLVYSSANARGIAARLHSPVPCTNTEAWTLATRSSISA